MAHRRDSRLRMSSKCRCTARSAASASPPRTASTILACIRASSSPSAAATLLGALLGDASWRYPFFGTAF
ncbi:hypothetical protein ACWC1C_38005, partial [Streptomyces sp. NPDC001705]